jgi:hypothetical protein
LGRWSPRRALSSSRALARHLALLSPPKGGLDLLSLPATSPRTPLGFLSSIIIHHSLVPLKTLDNRPDCASPSIWYSRHTRPSLPRAPPDSAPAAESCAESLAGAPTPGSAAVAGENSRLEETAGSLYLLRSGPHPMGVSATGRRAFRRPSEEPFPGVACHRLNQREWHWVRA